MEINVTGLRITVGNNVNLKNLVVIPDSVEYHVYWRVGTCYVFLNSPIQNVNEIIETRKDNYNNFDTIKAINDYLLKNASFIIESIQEVVFPVYLEHLFVGYKFLQDKDNTDNTDITGKLVKYI